MQENTPFPVPARPCPPTAPQAGSQGTSAVAAVGETLPQTPFLIVFLCLSAEEIIVLRKAPRGSASTPWEQVRPQGLWLSCTVGEGQSSLSVPPAPIRAGDWGGGVYTNQAQRSCCCHLIPWEQSCSHSAMGNERIINLHCTFSQERAGFCSVPSYPGH